MTQAAKRKVVAKYGALVQVTKPSELKSHPRIQRQIEPADEPVELRFIEFGQEYPMFVGTFSQLRAAAEKKLESLKQTTDIEPKIEYFSSDVIKDGKEYIKACIHIFEDIEGG